MFGVLIVLTIAFASHHGQSKEIIVDTNGGNTTCCIKGGCVCSSLSSALQHVVDNTIINIISEAITLDGNVVIGFGNNITIASHVVTITCSDSDALIACVSSCDDLTFSEITWVNCSLQLLNNNFLINCTLKETSLYMSGSIIIEKLSGLVRIGTTYLMEYVNLTTSESTFYSLFVSDSNCLAQWDITIVNSTFMANSQSSFTICANNLLNIYMVNINVRESFYGIQLELKAIGNISVSVISSVFFGNIGNALKCVIADTDSGNLLYTSVLISDTELINNEGFAGSTSRFGSLVDLYPSQIITLVFLL